MPADKKLKKLIADADGIIIYNPLPDEVNFWRLDLFLDAAADRLQKKQSLNLFLLPDDANSDPFKWAKKTLKYFDTKLGTNPSTNKEQKILIFVLANQRKSYQSRH